MSGRCTRPACLRSRGTRDPTEMRYVSSFLHDSRMRPRGLGGTRPVASDSPPSLLMIGNNYLKQLAVGARANSPAPICRSSNCRDSECSRCARRTMLFLKVVLVVSNSQHVWAPRAWEGRATSRPIHRSDAIQAGGISLQLAMIITPDGRFLSM